MLAAVVAHVSQSEIHVLTGVRLGALVALEEESTCTRRHLGHVEPCRLAAKPLVLTDLGDLGLRVQDPAIDDLAGPPVHEGFTLRTGLTKLVRLGYLVKVRD